MITQEKMQEILENLTSMDKDLAVPRNARLRIKKTISILTSEDEKNISLKIDQSLQELGDITEDPNLPQYARMQIWSVVSLLESK